MDGEIELSADLFVTSEAYVGIPNFTRCIFNGNQHCIFGSNYGVYGTFDSCVFNECSIQSSTNTGSLCQSLTVVDCSINNNVVSLVKCEKLYDCRLLSVKCEAQKATLIDTSFSTEYLGGTRNLHVANSLFEGWTTNPVFNLSGGKIHFDNCYFEANAAGCATITKQATATNYLNLSVRGCSITSTTHDAFTISGFTTNPCVIVSFVGNSWNSGGTPYYMVSGLDAAYNGLLSMAANKKGQSSDIFSAEPTYPYTFSPVIKTHTANSTYFTKYAGGFLQAGQLAVIDLTLLAKQDHTGTIQAVTGLPGPVNYKMLGDVVIASTGESAGVTFALYPNGNLDISGSITTGTYYRIMAYVITNRKDADVY